VVPTFILATVVSATMMKTSVQMVEPSLHLYSSSPRKLSGGSPAWMRAFSLVKYPREMAREAGGWISSMD
jgi:hypothetical protein